MSLLYHTRAGSRPVSLESGSSSVTERGARAEPRRLTRLIRFHQVNHGQDGILPINKLGRLRKWGRMSGSRWCVCVMAPFAGFLSVTLPLRHTRRPSETFGTGADRGLRRTCADHFVFRRPTSATSESPRPRNPPPATG